MDMLTKAGNPTERKVVRKGICIDSLFRKNYTSTSSCDFIYTLPEPINKVTSMRISSIEIPYVWYSFNDTDDSNVFTINIYNCPTPIDVDGTYPAFIQNVIRIPPGNYQSDLLVTAVNNMFSNIRNGLEFLFFYVDNLNTKTSFRSKHTGDDTSNAFTEAALPDNFYFEVDFRPPSDPTRPLYYNAGWMMGFREPFYRVSKLDVPFVDNYNYSFIEYAHHWHLRSESSYGSSLYNYLFLEIDDFNKNYSTNNYYSPTGNQNYLGNNIMARLCLTSGINTVMTNNPSDLTFKVREYFGPVKLEKLRIRLLNRFGTPVNMTNNDYSFLIEIDQIYST